MTPFFDEAQFVLAPVHFHIGAVFVQTEYDRSLLKLGTLVHVTRTSDATKPFEFARHPSATSVPHAVTWISPEWSVYLDAGFKAPAGLAAQLEQLTGLDLATIAQALTAAQSDVRLEQLYKTDEREGSAINTLSTVAERLRLVELLRSSEIGKLLNEHQEALITYLLLTCFDRLGQPAHRVDFGAWIASGRKRGEWQPVVDANPDGDPISVAAALYRRHSELYGVRSSFLRFLREILPSAARTELFECIQIGRLLNPPSLSPVPTDESHIEQWLYKLRNDYTHNGRFLANIPRHILETMPLAVDSWQMARQQHVGAEIWTDVTLRNWPDILIETVSAGLAETLSRLARDGATA